MIERRNLERKKLVFFGILRNCETFFDFKVLLCLKFLLELAVLRVWVGTIDSSSIDVGWVSIVYSSTGTINTVVESVVLWVCGVGVGVVVPGIRFGFGFSITLSKMVVWISRVST